LEGGSHFSSNEDKRPQETDMTNTQANGTVLITSPSTRIAVISAGWLANHSYLMGVGAALFGALAWSLNFVVPFVIGDYSIFDFALFRFVIPAALGLLFLLYKRDATRALTKADWLMTFFLGFIGYLAYFLTVAGAAIFAGPVIAPAFLGLVPVVLAIAGNLSRKVVSWRALSLSVLLTMVGLAFVNASIFDATSMATAGSAAIGILLAIAAVGLWTWFGLANQRALAVRPGIDAHIWTALILAGGGLEMLAFGPIGLALGVFNIPELGLGWANAAPLYIWGTALAVFASIGGALAWTFASQRLPVALSAQLLVSETIFGTMFGLAVHGRLPTLVEAGGLAVLTLGVFVTIRVFHGTAKTSRP
jgi:drug/metabolite transporter (DMT)-like permease